MSLIYEFDTKLKAMQPVLDEHAEWFGQVMRRIFYSQSYDSSAHLPPPASFAAWLADAQQEPSIGAVTLERLIRVHTELLETAERLVSSKAIQPELRAFDTFLGLYDGFIGQLRRLERDSLLADSGIDSMTGLRSLKAMDYDLDRELERRSRQGKPFCLILARIDDYPVVRACTDERQRAEIHLKIAAMIKGCIRPFDDAYRSDEAEFVMSLKHSNTAGGTAVVNRLRRFLKEEPISIVGKTGKTFPLTLSYCAAEPMPGDVIATMLGHMRSDLSRYNDGGDTALEYFEQSPLQRFIQTMEEPPPHDKNH